MASEMTWIPFFRSTHRRASKPNLRDFGGGGVQVGFGVSKVLAAFVTTPESVKEAHDEPPSSTPLGAPEDQQVFSLKVDYTGASTDMLGSSGLSFFRAVARTAGMISET